MSSVLADDSNSNSEQITVHVDEAGTLGEILRSMGYGYHGGPSDLRLTGVLNIDDIKTIRDYAGTMNRYGNYSHGYLKHLDIANVQLRDGEGTVRYRKGDDGTVPMVISGEGHCISGLFAALDSLQSVILPDCVTDIDDLTFSDLTSITLPVGLKSISCNKYFCVSYAITSIYAKNPYPPKCDIDVFKSIGKNCVIYVPKGSGRLYNSSQDWGRFQVVDYDYMPTEELITRPFSINVKQAGTLRSLIKDNVKYRLTDVKISGKLNIDDIEFIREMAGCDYGQGGPAYQGHLQYLNLKDVQFVGSDKIVGIYGDPILQTYTPVRDKKSFPKGVIVFLGTATVTLQPSADIGWLQL